MLKTEYSRKPEEQRRATLDRPLDYLRCLIPHMDRTENPRYEVDPGLNLEHLEKKRWTEFYDEGIDVMTRFNRELSKAIAADGKGKHPHRTDPSSRIHRLFKYVDKEVPNFFHRERDEFTSHSDLVKEAFMNEYFPSTFATDC